jgi:hypothetical protein
MNVIKINKKSYHARSFHTGREICKRKNSTYFMIVRVNLGRREREKIPRLINYHYPSYNQEIEKDL